jgi:hypothetical protein
MKCYVEVEVNFIKFLTLTLDLCRWLASRSTPSTSGKITPASYLLLLFLLLLEALQLQKRFDLLKDILPFDPVFDAVLVVIFILVMSLFTSSPNLFLGLPKDPSPLN